MRCARCGRENADHVAYCEDCGFTLRRAQSRPVAPAFELGPPGPVCAACRTKNQPGFRFCITCGGPLAAPAPVGDPITAPPVTQPDGLAAVAAAAHRAGASTAPPPEAQALHASPTISVESTASPAAASPSPSPPATPSPAMAGSLRPCARCGAANDSDAVFCRTCGLSLVLVPEAPRKFGATLALSPAKASPPRAPAPAPAPPVPPSSPLGAPAPAFPPVAVSAPVAPARLGRIVALATDGTDREAWDITADSTDLGGRDGDVVLPGDPFLSARHGRITRDGAAFVVHDLASTNGVYLRLRGPTPIRDGDLILLGQQVLRFDVVNATEQALRPAVQHGTALFGTPQAPVHARLCQRTVEGITRDVFHMTRPELSLGREVADVVFTDDAFLSRRHAIIRRTSGGEFVVEDLNSSNGTFVAIRGHHPLTDGDILRMGLHMFRIELYPAAAKDRGAMGAEAPRA